MPISNPLEDVSVLVIFAVISFVAYEIGFQIGTGTRREPQACKRDRRACSSARS